jgi:UDP-N-acetylmuramoylalanine--D-glutamate ligase
LSEGPEVFYFSRRIEVKGIYCLDGKIYCNMPGFVKVPVSEPLLEADAIKIKGVHNLENAMAASAMALLADCPVEAVIDSLREFGGLEHRLEMVRELDGVRYVNDSKGTNVGAVIKSVESFDAPLILIAGGRDKAGDFSALRAPVAGRVKALVLIGEAADKIKDALGDVAETVTAKDLREAVELSRKKAEKGDVVLLSPACASFDMFKDFEDRGRQFKKIVMDLNGGQNA